MGCKLSPVVSSRRFAPDKIIMKRSTAKFCSNNSGLSGTCFYIGEGKILHEQCDKLFFVTCDHVVGAELTILLHFSKSFTCTATVLYRNDTDDISILSCDDPDLKKRMNGVYELELEDDLHVGEAVFAFGFPSSGSHSHKSALQTTTVNHLIAGARPSKGDTAANLQWRTSHFFIMNGVMDYGCSGGPVLNGDGDVVGMLCEAQYEGLSFCLRGNYIRDHISRADIALKE